MFILVYQGQIAGTSESADNLPGDFLAVPYTGVGLDSIYWDGKEIMPKPDRPDDTAYWDSVTNQWVTPEVPEEPELVNPLTRHELAPVLYQILAEVHPALAECLTYLLATTQGDNDTASQMLDNLIVRCTEYKRIQDEGTDDRGSTNTRDS